MSELVEGPADLTPIQRKALRNFRDYCDSPPTLISLCWKNLFAFVIVVVYFGGLAAVVFAALDEIVFAAFLGGIGFGFLMYQLAAFRNFLRIWPAMEAVIDRDRLDEFIDEPPVDSTAPDDWS